MRARQPASLARKKIITLETESLLTNLEEPKPPRTLNIHQLDAYNQIEAALRAKQFQTFLLHGVTGSGKTEVYLRAIDACLAFGQSALLLVPEIALTPAVAGQFYHRFGDQVAILHSAFNEAERAEQWRRIRGRPGPGRRRHPLRRVRAGAKSRPGHRRRRARRQLQAGGDSALQRPRRGHRPRPGSQRRGRARLGHPQSRNAATTRRRASTR